MRFRTEYETRNINEISFFVVVEISLACFLELQGCENPVNTQFAQGTQYILTDVISHLYLTSVVCVTPSHCGYHGITEFRSVQAAKITVSTGYHSFLPEAAVLLKGIYLLLGSDR